MITKKIDVAVIGGGPAGMAAAQKAAEMVESVMLIERDNRLGGILNQCIHPGFGLVYFQEELTGPEYAQRFAELVNKGPVHVMTDTMVISISGSHRILAVNAMGMLEIQARAIILAMGCRERTRGNIGLPGTRPAGVMTAGMAQRYINVENLCPGKRAVILGSGDIGLIMARRLILENIEVEGVYEVLPYANGLARNVRQCLEDFKIPLHLSTTVVEVHGEERLTGVTVAMVDELRRVKEETRRYIPCDLLLLSVGLIPENELSQAAGIDLGGGKGPVVNERLETSVPGVFACGNVLHVHDEADHVTKEAEKAGINAAAYAKARTNKHQESSQYGIKPGKDVQYTVPCLVSVGHKAPLEILFRVTRPIAGGRIVVSSGKIEVYRSKKSLALRPGNMCEVQLTAEMTERIKGDILVSVEEDEK